MKEPMNETPKFSMFDRIRCLFGAVLGAVMLAWNHHHAIQKGEIYLALIGGGVMLVMFGLAGTFCPTVFTNERMVNGKKRPTPAGWVLAGVAFALVIFLFEFAYPNGWLAN